MSFTAAFSLPFVLGVLLIFLNDGLVNQLKYGRVSREKHKNSTSNLVIFRTNSNLKRETFWSLKEMYLQIHVFFYDN
jgi:hypothetical protein